MDVDAFQVLADETRRRIVEVMRGGEKQVNDIVDRAGVHQSGVSRHLKILLENGWVTVRPDRQRRMYSLRPEPFREMERWLESYRELWEKRMDRFGEALEKRRKR